MFRERSCFVCFIVARIFLARDESVWDENIRQRSTRCLQDNYAILMLSFTYSLSYHPRDEAGAPYTSPGAGDLPRHPSYVMYCPVYTHSRGRVAGPPLYKPRRLLSSSSTSLSRRLDNRPRKEEFQYSHLIHTCVQIFFAVLFSRAKFFRERQRERRDSLAGN